MGIFGKATRKAVTHAAELVLELMILLDKLLNKKKKKKKIERCLCDLLVLFFRRRTPTIHRSHNGGSGSLCWAKSCVRLGPVAQPRTTP
jgi:hypothetical protein